MQPKGGMPHETPPTGKEFRASETPMRTTGSRLPALDCVANYILAERRRKM